ncbi:MAG: GNAT family N-acetyltransferase [Proteobacteria bacterium]|nr:GNAT family N-acetyltransferase [Pseudomonadota bacterium]
MRDVIAIETKRLNLRPIAMSDAQRIARFCDDPGVGRMLAMTPLPYLEAAAEGWIMTMKARAPLDRDFVFAVDAPGEGLIGCVGAHRDENGDVEIGYWFGRPYWGVGYGSEAVAAFVAQAQVLGSLNAGHFIDNPASGHVLKKAGFTYTGETKRMFSMGRGESVDCLRMRYGAGEYDLAAHEAALVN